MEVVELGLGVREVLKHAIQASVVPSDLRCLA